VDGGRSRGDDRILHQSSPEGYPDESGSRGNDVFLDNDLVESCRLPYCSHTETFARQQRRQGSSVLDVGAGAGVNLRMLRGLNAKDVIGLDSDELAISCCLSKNLGQVRRGHICAIPFADESFDFVVATDVIE
jgi:2-polyprenyl-3-methyl-5-hydroxy-6-metoxy-1,4-benzoquinol methylase